MSERVERRLVEMLGHQRRSPYGNAIPGLSELCDVHKTGAEAPPGVLSMADYVENGGTNCMLFRIGEGPQALEGFLEDVVAIGLLPGTLLRLAEVPDGVEIATERGTIVIDGDVARHLFVRTDSKVGS